MNRRPRVRALQAASVLVMLLTLVAMNLVVLGASVFDRAVDTLARGLEMTVYLKSEGDPATVTKLVNDSQDFDHVDFATAETATKRFLSGLGPDSLALLDDPKWTSPIPATLALKVSDRVEPKRRVTLMREWAARFKTLEVVEDVFYGDAFAENFGRFVAGARALIVFTWLLGSAIGLLIVGNCIRLSFAQRRDEVEVLELVGATSGFVRRPFLIEGFVIGLVAAVGSLLVSWPLHLSLLAGLRRAGEPWVALANGTPFPWWGIPLCVAVGVAFGLLGAWFSVRRLNTGWSAAG